MNEGYKQRREEKHKKQAETKARKPKTSGLPVIDLTPRVPRLSFVGLKSHKQGNGGRSGRSGHLPEHIEALKEDAARTAAKQNEVVLNNLQVNEQMTDTL